MANLTAEAARLFDASIEPVLVRMGVVASGAIFRGSACGLSSVSARKLTAGDSFLGFAEETQDNSAGSAGDKTIAIRQKGVVQIDVTGVSSATAYGTAIYASDGATFTTASTGNTQIGKFLRWITGTTCLVYFEGLGVRSI